MGNFQAIAQGFAVRPPAIWLAVRKLASFPAVLCGCLCVVIFNVCTTRLTDPDTWWHLSVGDGILKTRNWPLADSYSFTANGSGWIAYEWLGEILIAAAASLGGLQMMVVLLASLMASLALLLAYYSYLRCRNPKAAVLSAALLLPLCGVFLALRPQMPGYIFLLITLICLERFRQGRRRALWGLPPMFVVWVNTHGTFIFGLAVLGLYWISGLAQFEWGGIRAERWTTSQSRRLLVATLLCALALTLTPYGTRVAAYPFQMALLQPTNIGNIVEWQAIGAMDGALKTFLALLLPFILTLFALRPRCRLPDLLFLLFAIYAACVHVRFVALFVLALAPFLGEILARWLPEYDAAKDHYAINAVIMLVFMAAAVRLAPSQQHLQERIDAVYPTAALAYLDRHPVAGPMLNEYRWGGYLIWKRGPSEKVFIDGRADIYEYSGVLSDYLSITRLDGNTLFLLRKYGVEACLIERKRPLATLLAALPEWSRVYQDDISVVFLRQPQEKSAGK